MADNQQIQSEHDLLLFQMGPVQEFIAQAATPSDLWAGSYLLSDLILAGIKAVPDYTEAVIFPNLTKGESKVLDAMESKLIPTIPNRFLAFVPAGDGPEIARKVKKEIEGKLKILGAGLPEGAKTQLDQFLQITWAVLQTPGDNMGENYAKISRILALRRNVREFDPWREEDCVKKNGFNGPKDFLSGKETALKDGRGAMNLIKKELPGKIGKKIPTIETDDDKYLAVIALDGDKMGVTLSGLKTKDEHRNFSKWLAEFAMSVEGMMPENGVLLYAGGDDVLAVVPSKTAINVAKTIAEAFAMKMKDFRWKDDDGIEHKVTASAGIAVGHQKTPLLDLVLAAQDAEHRAKNTYSRNALALSVFKRSGEILEWGCNWDSEALSLHDEIVKSLKDELSARFPYKLAAFLEPYELDADMEDGMESVVLKELENVWERSPAPEASKKGTAEEIETLAHKAAKAYLHETFEKGNPQDFLNLFLCETFVNRQRSEED